MCFMPTNAEISPGLKRLLQEAADGQLATLMPDGSPQLTQVWLDTDGTHVLVNTGAGHQKAKNIERDPRVAINVHDPASAARIATIRGRVVEITATGAEEHIAALATKYLGTDQYPFRRPGEQRIILKIQPEKIYSIGLDGTAWHPPANGMQT
jgi:PPOX class probable F420-dependent enzyme